MLLRSEVAMLRLFKELKSKLCDLVSGSRLLKRKRSSRNSSMLA